MKTDTSYYTRHNNPYSCFIPKETPQNLLAVEDSVSLGCQQNGKIEKPIDTSHAEKKKSGFLSRLAKACLNVSLGALCCTSLGLVPCYATNETEITETIDTKKEEKNEAASETKEKELFTGEISTPLEVLTSTIGDIGVMTSILTSDALTEKKEISIERTVEVDNRQIKEEVSLKPVDSGLTSRTYKAEGDSSTGHKISFGLTGSYGILSGKTTGKFKGILGRSKFLLDFVYQSSKEETSVKGFIGTQKVEISLKGKSIKSAKIGGATGGIDIKEADDNKDNLVIKGSLQEKGKSHEINGKIVKVDGSTYEINHKCGEVSVQETIKFK